MFYGTGEIPEREQQCGKAQQQQQISEQRLVSRHHRTRGGAGGVINLILEDMGRRPIGSKARARSVTGVLGNGGRNLLNGEATDAALSQEVVAPSNTNGKQETSKERGERGKGKNPLMGLLHYGSDSEDEQAAGPPSASQKRDASSGFTVNKRRQEADAAALGDVSTGESTSTTSSAVATSVGDTTIGVSASTATLDLPSGWQQCMDNAGLVYFWNTETGETTWDPPGIASNTSRRLDSSTQEDQETSVRVGPQAAEDDTSSTILAPPSSSTPTNVDVDVAAVNGTGEMGNAGSDATSDTASEPDDDDEVGEHSLTINDTVGNMKISTEYTAAMMDLEDITSSETSTAGMDDGRGVEDKIDNDRNSDDHDALDGLKTTENTPIDREGLADVETEEKGEVQESTTAMKNSGTTSSTPEPLASTVAGVDDLFADIEAELLSGGGGVATADDSNSKNGPALAEEENAGLEQQQQHKVEEVEDFSPLLQIAPGLDTRARREHAELVGLLASLEKEEEIGRAGLAGDGGAKFRLAVELGAVLRSRLSDWKEGGLGGVFLVRRLEEMVRQARSSLLSPSSSSSPTPPTEAESLSPHRSSAASRTPAVPATPAAAVDSKNTEIASSHTENITPSAHPSADNAEQKAASSTKTTSPEKGKEVTITTKVVPTKRRCLRSGTIKALSTPTTTATLTEESSGSSAGDKGGGVEKAEENQTEEISAAVRAAPPRRSSPRSSRGPTARAEAESKTAAKALRAEQAAEKLRWADEVSAAASAAVAAAAALSQAKKDDAKAKAKAASKKRSSLDMSQPEKQRNNISGSESVDEDRIFDEQSEEGAVVSDRQANNGHAADAASKKPAAIVSAGEVVAEKGKIELGGVGGEDDDDEEEGEVSIKEEAVAGKAAPAQESDTIETGIVIAKEPPLLSGWAAILDETHGAYYYHNLATDETTWVRPQAPAIASPAEGQSSAKSTTALSASTSSKSTTALSASTSSKGDKHAVQETADSSKAAARKEDDRAPATARGGRTRVRKSSSRRSRKYSEEEDRDGDARAPAAATAPRAGRENSTIADGKKVSSTKADVTSTSAVETPAGPAAATAPRTGSESGTMAGKKKVSSTKADVTSTAAVETPVATTAAVAEEGGGKGSSEGTLPSPWVPVFDKIQRAFYYHNTVTDETTWERPAAHLAAKPSTVADVTVANDDHPTTVTGARGNKKKSKTTPTADAIVAGEANEVTAAAATAPAINIGEAFVHKQRSDSVKEPATEPPAPDAPVPSAAADMRPYTLVWWSDAGDVWSGVALSGLLTGYGPRRYRNLGGGYYMTTLELGPEWAAAAAGALGQGVADPVGMARVDWVCCTASAPEYGLFLRWAGDDDEEKLFEVPDEFFDDPPPDPAIAAAEKAAAAAAAAQAVAYAEAEAAAAAAAAEAEAAIENAEAEAAAAAAVAATEEAEAAGSEAAAAAAIAVPVVVEAPAPAAASSKKRKKGSASGSSSSSGVIGKKRKGMASLIDKWKTVASSAGEEAEKEAEKQEKMERWKARAAAMDPENPNFTPIGRKRR